MPGEAYLHTRPVTRASRLLLLIMAVALATATPAMAQQQIPPPTGPVVFCGAQAPPTADTYQMIFDGGTPEAVTMTAPDAGCPVGSTHSYSVPASRFTVGSHTVQIRGTNQFGSTTGPSFTVVVGVAPGQFTTTGVIPPGGGARTRSPTAKPRVRNDVDLPCVAVKVESGMVLECVTSLEEAERQIR